MRQISSTREGKVSRRLPSLVLTVVLALLVCGCGPAVDSDSDPTEPESTDGSGTAETESSGSLTVYGGTAAERLEALAADFMEEYPEIEVTTFHQPTEQLMTTLQLELDAGEARADIIQGSEPAVVGYGEANPGHLAQYSPSTLEGVDLPEALSSPDGSFHPQGGLVYHLAYNTEIVSEDDAPRSFLDYTDTRWRDQVVIADPRSAGSVHPFIWVVTEYLADDPGYGWEYFEALGANNPHLAGGHSDLMQLVISGERPVGPVTTSNITPAIEAGEPVDFYWPEEGTTLIGTGLAMVESAPNRTNAELFMDWAFSEAGQRSTVDALGLAPVLPGMGHTFPDGSSLSEIDIVPVPGALVAEQTEETAERTHEALEEGGG